MKKTDKLAYYIVLLDKYSGPEGTMRFSEWYGDNYDDLFNQTIGAHGPEYPEMYILKSKLPEERTVVDKEYKSSSGILQKNIATWYKALRRIALVGLLTVLVYIGIRILLCSTAQEKSKYKKMMIDWVAAICILYILHFLMAGILTISSEISGIFGKEAQETLAYKLPKGIIKVNGQELPEDKTAWVGSFVGFARLMCGIKDTLRGIIYAIIYVALVMYTVIFTFMYLKRVLYMAFLTMIAPLIALTYPIDKIKDGNAQAFGLWLREYIFNALLQPVHLILYILLIGNAMELAVDYPLYAIAALGFMVPAEKFLRKMFGFEKAGTVSQLGAAAGGALVMNGINHLRGLGRGAANIGKGQKNGGKEGEERENGNNQVRTVNNPNMNAGNVPNQSTTSTNTQEASGNGGNAQESAGRRINQETSEGEGNNPTQQHQQQQSQAVPQQQNDVPLTNHNNNIKNKPKTTKGAIWKASKQVLGSSLKGSAKLAGGALLGGTGLMIGGVAGITTGEIGNIGKYGALGVTAGGALGSGLAEGASNLAGAGIRIGKEGVQAGKDAKSGASQFKAQGIKDQTAIETAQQMGLSPETAGMAYNVAQRIPKEILYDDAKLKNLLAQGGVDESTQKKMLDYIKKFR